MFLSKLTSPFWRRLTLHALWLHVIWEFVQCLLFYEMKGVAFTSAFFSMIAATGADVVVTLALVVFALRFARGHSNAVALWTLAACGTIAAVLIEILALAFGWWRYSPAMPTVEFAGRNIGFLPVAQMALLPALAFLLARFPFSSKSN